MIEILVVVAITALLSSLAIIYTHIGQNQISLSIEESKVAQLILEAKELSVATYSENGTTCGYGVEFNYADPIGNSTYSLFAYNAAASSSQPGGRPICPTIASTSAAIDTDAIQEYTDGNWQIHPAQGVELVDPASAASDTIQYVLFYPPDPCTLISTDSSTFQSNCAPPASGYGAPPGEAYVYLSTVDGSEARTISVSPAGQISL